MKFKGTLVITDPCYMKRSSSLMERGTIYGDWTCMVYKGSIDDSEMVEKVSEWGKKYLEFWHKVNNALGEERKNLVDEFDSFKHIWLKENTYGEFTADAGLVGIFDWDKLDSSDMKWIVLHPWCVTVIDDFDGDVEFNVVGNSVHIIGTGNKPFFSTQSGF